MASPSTLTPAFDYGPIERYATGGDDLQPKIDELQMRAHKLLSEAVAMREDAVNADAVEDLVEDTRDLLSDLLWAQRKGDGDYRMKDYPGSSAKSDDAIAKAADLRPPFPPND